MRDRRLSEPSRRTPGPLRERNCARRTRRGVWFRHWVRRLSSSSSPGVMGPGFRRDDHRDRFWKDEIMQRLNPTGTLTIGSSELEYRMIGPSPDAAPTIVLLHEGLGSVGLWGDFPEQARRRHRRRRVRLFARGLWRLTARCRCRDRWTTCMSRRWRCCRRFSTPSAFAAGCCSAIPTAPRSRRSTPAVSRITGFAGVAMIAPHFVVEDISVQSIAEIKTAYEQGDAEGEARALAPRRRQRLLRLERRLARCKISRLGYFGIPRLHPRADRRSCRAPTTSTARCGRSRSPRRNAIARSTSTIIPGAAHSPHREAPDVTLRTIADFANRILLIHGEGRLRAA